MLTEEHNLKTCRPTLSCALSLILTPLPLFSALFSFSFCVLQFFFDISTLCVFLTVCFYIYEPWTSPQRRKHYVQTHTCILVLLAQTHIRAHTSRTHRVASALKQCDCLCSNSPNGSISFKLMWLNIKDLTCFGSDTIEVSIFRRLTNKPRGVSDFERNPPGNRAGNL